MARMTKPLSATEVKEAKPRDKEYLLADGGGLILKIRPTGSKTWLFNYTTPLTKKRTNIKIGSFPEITLAQARIKRDEFRALLAQKIDLQVEKQRQKQEAESQIKDTFCSVAESYFGGIYQQKAKNPETREKNWARLENHIFPYIGDLHISDVKVKLLVDIYEKVADRSNTLKKLHRLVTAIMDHAITKGIIESHNGHLAVKSFHLKAYKPTPTIKIDDLEETYNRHNYLNQRIPVMNFWGKYLEKCGLTQSQIITY